MATFRTKLQSFVFIYVLAPLLVVMTFFLIALYQRMRDSYREEIDLFRGATAQVLSAELTRTERAVSSLAALPQVSTLLGGAMAARQKFDASKVTVEDFFRWIQTGEGFTPAKGVQMTPEKLLNNVVSERFALLRKDEPAMVDFILTDNLGDVIAGNGGEPGNFLGADWWRTAFRERRATVFYEPRVDDTGRFAMYTAIWDSSTGQLMPLGALRVIVDLNKVMETFREAPVTPGYALMAMNAGKWTAAFGDPKVLESVTIVAGEVQSRFARDGWSNRVHFRAKRLDDRFVIDQNDQMLLIGLREDSLVPATILHRTAFAGVLSLLILLGVCTAAWLAARSMVNTNAANLDAGLWLLHRVRGEAGVPATTAARVDKTALGREIHEWESAFRRTVTEDVRAHAFESLRDLDLAHDFQMAYLNRPYPKVPAIPVPGRLSLRFHHRYSPALALGGDFFDLAPLSQESVGLFIADVMGHGTRSALITSILRTLIIELKPQARNARNFLREMNRTFCGLVRQVRMEHPLFTSAYYFVADTTARAATFSTAGHPAPFLVRGATNSTERLRVSEPHGSALGIHPDEEYTGGSCRLFPGDVFIFFTDGAYECFNAKGEEFGMDGIEAALRRHMHQGVVSMVNGLMDAIADFSSASTLRDDICIVGVEVNEESSAVEKARTGRIILPGTEPGTGTARGTSPGI